MLSFLAAPEYLQREEYLISGARTVCITEKIRRSLDKKKTDSSSKKINIDWINWINEVISSSNENKINKNNNIYKNKQQPFLSPKTNEDLKKNFSYDSLKNIAKIRSNNQFFK